ncbi:MAG: amidohydrolase family protein [Alistipes sp.]|nr:amidohydrolase family protein [Alistipes sp.]
MLRPLVTLSDEGVVVAIEQWDRLDSEPLTVFHSGAIIPQMVNAHCHLELSYLRGEIPRGCGFAGFASHLRRVRDAFSREQRERAMAAADSAMAAEGVAVVGDVANGDESFSTKAHSPIEYHTFAEVFGYRDNLEQASQLLSHPRTTLSPHSCYSLQSGVFQDVVRRSEGSPLSIHFLESAAERELYRGEGALAEWYHSMGWEWDFLSHYRSPVERLIAEIPPHQELLLVHNCFITEEDVERLTAHFSSVTFVLCPASNDYLSGVMPPAAMLWRKGCKVAIGTDSLASAESLSVWDNVLMLKDVPLPTAVRWATEGGARALHSSHSGKVAIGEKIALVDKVHLR